MKPILNQAKGALKNLLEDAQIFQALLEVGRDNLPEDLKPHLVGVGFEGQTLLLQIDVAVFATQLRFYEPTILGCFQEHFPHYVLNRVKVQILPQTAPPERKIRPRQLPNESDAQMMQQLSEEIESPGLSAALKKLSQLAQKKSP
ncbi:DciA family protein [Thiomicrorhabdus heinhorstiae]|uniref:DUF721 domain-containing protein n=1 Tax=Thiomicrorhabdus heinhorstiae TaxID=2748010 RepID=A0ABS0BZS3_9GAMM|nr:DciA family protein [Thiomicrorhabdus heinhorstiae]MBF6058583.1 DUF721 domain-containing protein [Thiomicrorhabdus heinhorstiae]